MIQPTEVGSTGSSNWAALYGELLLWDGLAAIPKALFLYQGELGLSAQQVWFVAEILSHKWQATLPHPSISMMARTSGLTSRGLQKIRASLEQAGFLQIQVNYTDQGRTDSNSYDFTNLFARLEVAIAGDPRRQLDLEDAPAAPSTWSSEPQSYSFVARFGRVIAQTGVAQIPHALFRYQGVLQLTMQQVWFVCYILAHHMYDPYPHPSLHRMAQRTGYSLRHIFEIKETLITANYLEIRAHSDAETGAQETNEYDFGKLFTALRLLMQGHQPTPNSTEPRVTPAPATSSPEVRRNGRRRGVAHMAEMVLPPSSAKDAKDKQPQQPVGVNGSAPGRANAQLEQQRTGEGEQQRTGEGERQRIGEGERQRTREGERQHIRESEQQRTGEGERQRTQIEERLIETNTVDDSNPTGRQKQGRRSQEPRLSSVAVEPTEARRYSMFIIRTTTDFSAQLGDTHHETQNSAQAMNLWNATTLSEEAFVDFLREAYNRTRKSQGKQGQGSIDNKMAYFFATLRDVLKPHLRAANAQGEGY